MVVATFLRAQRPRRAKLPIERLKDATLEQSGTTTFLSWKDGDAVLLVGIRHAQADRSGKLRIAPSQSPRGFSLSYWRGSADRLPRSNAR